MLISFLSLILKARGDNRILLPESKQTAQFMKCTYLIHQGHNFALFAGICPENQVIGHR
ncbi:hypothetical protein X474_06610 [Dethiosulfatarculus sandiegensis]|uniref:Uncharacterized protein n=1 Tax=Dethiosulfatarculus sandiegensis TaxID=1429043 RepID=A0A0D2JGE7_9BACT|nr:hypothetical protein X474_06610 [Dethiosulfatarculus sandiegensis]